jgi:hypothetical protein
LCTEMDVNLCGHGGLVRSEKGVGFMIMIMT